MSGPLTGVKVLDMSRVLAGPYCTMILGDMGAEVIKVEVPGRGDDTRHWGPPFQHGESAYFFSANRNKRSIAINLQSEEGRTIVKELARNADVLIHNFKFGTMEKWNLDYDSLKLQNPRLVYCGISGFGKTGPFKKLAGYDFIIQAMSGLMSITGTDASGPLKVGVAISDVLTGMYAAIGILGALTERNESGEGQSIDLALFDSQISALVNVASNYLVSGDIPQRLGNDHPNIVPYQTFQAEDRELVVAVGNDMQFQRLCQLLNLDHLANDARFVTNENRLEHREELTELLASAFRQKSTDEWVRLLNETSIPCGPINDMQALFASEQVQTRGMLVHLDHPQAGKVSLVGSPLQFSRTKVTMRRHPPLLGEHTDEVLKELGMETNEINELRQNNIIS